MKKSCLLLSVLALASAAAMADVTTTTTTTRHTTSIEPAVTVPTVVTVHTHPARRHVVRHVRRVRHVVIVHKAPRKVIAKATVDTRRMGGPGTTTTTTVTRHSTRVE